MAALRRLPPIWVMGFGFLPLGSLGAIILISIPQLLAANHVPEPTIASMTGVVLVPGFCGFIFGPLLDWRFDRRTYSVVFTIVGFLCSFAALASIQNLALLTTLCFAGNLAIGLCISAVGGWFGNLVPTDDKGALGAWFTVANIAGGGLVAIVALWLLRTLPYIVGAGVLSASILVVLPLYFWTPCPPADGRLASESVRDFTRDVLALLKKPSVLWTLPLFLLPASSFALTNILGGVGRDFKTSEAQVSFIAGAGSIAAGVVGSLIIPHVSKKVSPRPLYLLVGGLGAMFTLICVVLPRTPTTFALAFLGENAFQAAAFTVGNLIVLRTVGHDNPLAATQFGLLTAAYSLPLTYMQFIDGQAYGGGGIAGSFIADALVSGAACILLAAGLRLLRRQVPAL